VEFQGDTGNAVLMSVVEIGRPDSLGVKQDVSYGLLLNLQPRLPRDAEHRCSKPWDTSTHPWLGVVFSCVRGIPLIIVCYVRTATEAKRQAGHAERGGGK
jgi:hypothetical protein